MSTREQTLVSLFGGATIAILALGAIVNAKESSDAMGSERWADAERKDEIKRGHATAKARLAATDTNDGCGQQPRPDAWDNGIGVIEKLVLNDAHDPDSIDVEDCTMPVKTDLCWETICKIRGTNGFGAKVLETHRYSISKTAVIQVN